MPHGAWEWGYERLQSELRWCPLQGAGHWSSPVPITGKPCEYGNLSFADRAYCQLLNTWKAPLRPIVFPCGDDLALRERSDRNGVCALGSTSVEAPPMPIDASSGAAIDRIWDCMLVSGVYRQEASAGRSTVTLEVGAPMCC
jgi:hypothetical protein